MTDRKGNRKGNQLGNWSEHDKIDERVDWKRQVIEKQRQDSWQEEVAKLIGGIGKDKIRSQDQKM